MIHLYLPPFAVGSDYPEAAKSILRQAADTRTLCGLPLPQIVDERREDDLPNDTRCDKCLAGASERFRPKYVVLPG